MNDLAPIFERVAAINPVPDENDLPVRGTSVFALLDDIDERTGTVQIQQPKPSNPRARGDDESELSFRWQLSHLSS